MRYDQSYIARLLAKHLSEGLLPEEKVILDEWADASEVNRAILEEVEDPERFARILEDYEYIDPEIAWKELQKREPELLKIDYDDQGRPGWFASLRARFRSFFENNRRSTTNLAFGFVLISLIAISLIRLALSYRNRTMVFVQQPLTRAGFSASPKLAGVPVLELSALALGASDTSGCMMATKTAVDEIDLQLLTGCNTSFGGMAFVLRSLGSWMMHTRLADSTHVQLNVGSQLQVPAYDARNPNREVTLTGEGYFNVKSSRDDVVGKPFVVHVPFLKSLNIISLGTQFNVKAYPKDGYVLTNLVEGRVLLQIGVHKLELKAGQSAIVDSSGIPRIEASPVTTSSWKDGVFCFTSQPTFATIEELARAYNVHVKFLGSRPTAIYGTLRGFHSDPLDVLLDRLSLLAHFSYKIKADTVYVSH